jgi:omega-hydroxy-beta-dihydromenaquinone-9 sulfotransferase
MWLGCDLPAWLRLLARNRFAVAPPYLYVAAIVTWVSAGHHLLRYVQNAWFGSGPDHAPLADDPLFIIGHWRTGTTLLHELLICDEAHTFPNTYQCMVPSQFLLSERFGPRLLGWLLPSRRPMDNMEAGWDKPQEDEFALCMLGQPSPYLTIAFPNHPPQDQEALDLESLPRRARESWKRSFLRFLRHLSFKDPRRLVLKSPTHSCRIPTLVELFPRARLVPIVRDPYVVFASTVNLWKALYLTQAFQTPSFAGLEECVFSTFLHLYERIETGKPLVPAGQFHELRYEDLTADPLGQMQRLYEALGLEGFERARPRIEAYLARHTGYKTNPYPQLSEPLTAEITRRWGPVIRRYGYG